MPIVSRRELERRRALAQNTQPVAGSAPEPSRLPADPIQPRPRRTPVRPDDEPSPPAPLPQAPANDSARKDVGDTPDPLWPEGSLSADREYEEGKYRPPVKNRFPKGMSGNPAGRPKKSRGLKTVVREALTKKVDLRDAHGRRRVSMIEALVQKLVELASKGNLRAIDALLKLYTSAVPDAAEIISAAVDAEELSAGDEAGLALLREIIRSEKDGDPEGEMEPC